MPYILLYRRPQMLRLAAAVASVLLLIAAGDRPPHQLAVVASECPASGGREWRQQLGADEAADPRKLDGDWRVVKTQRDG